MKSKRNQRIDSELRKNIYDILKNKLSLGFSDMFTVSEVDCSPDLKHAKVYVSIYAPTEEKKKSDFAIIEGFASQVRKELGHMMSTRTVPELHFAEDTAFAYGDKIDKIISTLTYGDNNGGSEGNNN